MSAPSDIAAIAIGRNEGARLVACLTSLQGHVGRLVYVDSGSSDGSQQAARDLGAEVIALDMSRPFTAARARNAGLAHVMQGDAPPHYIQFLDGDCALQPGWITQARAVLDKDAQVAVVCGRRRERFPDASLYNALIDLEWDTPVGQAKSCGGDALMRAQALQQVGGYSDSMIAGEEPELCVRLRAQGWTIWRIAAEMTLHDAAMTRFGQWWQRAKRAGHAYAEGAARHGAPPERHNVAPLRRAVVWGAGLPVLSVIGALFTPWALLLLGLWPLQVARLYARRRNLWQALFLTLGKLPEAQGALSYLWGRIRGRGQRLIEYK